MKPRTPYGQGYISGLSNKDKAPPHEFNAAQRKAWISGYEDATKPTDTGQRRTMTR